MKKPIFLLISLLTFLFLSNVVFAIAMPVGIALNHETKECAGYWGGDEFSTYTLPNGWKDYYPNYSEHKETGKLVIKTEIGNCNISAEIEKRNNEDCCNQLGYTFVAQNIGKAKITEWGLINSLGQLACSMFFPIVILLMIIFVFLKIKTKLFIPFLERYSSKGLFIGLIIGLLSSLSFYGISTFLGCSLIYPIANLFKILSLPIFGIIHSFFNETLSSWFFLLILNLLYFGLIGWILGLLIQKIKKN